MLFLILSYWSLIGICIFFFWGLITKASDVTKEQRIFMILICGPLAIISFGLMRIYAFLGRKK